MSQIPNQPPENETDEFSNSRRRHPTIHSRDKVTAGGVPVQTIAKVIAKKTDDVFELPEEVNREITWKIFHPKVEKAKRMTKLNLQLTEENILKQLEALDEINDLLDQKRGDVISTRKMRQIMIDGIMAISVLLKNGQIRILNPNNIRAFHHLNREFQRVNHMIDTFELELLSSIFNDIQPVIPKI